MLATPLATRCILALSAFFYLAYKVSDHFHVDPFYYLVCKPSGVIYRFELHTLLFASLFHTNLAVLFLAIFVSWHLFTWFEYRVGTLGFFLWFIWMSVLFHSCYCCFAFALHFYAGQIVMNGDVYGLWPLVIMQLVSINRQTNTGSIWLWPLPLKIPVWVFLPVVLMVALFCHLEAKRLHLIPHDAGIMVLAYFCSGICPNWLEPPFWMLDAWEQSKVGRWLTAHLQYDSFVTRPPAMNSGCTSSESMSAIALQNMSATNQREGLDDGEEVIIGATVKGEEDGAGGFSMMVDEDRSRQP